MMQMIDRLLQPGFHRLGMMTGIAIVRMGHLHPPDAMKPHKNCDKPRLVPGCFYRLRTGRKLDGGRAARVVLPSSESICASETTYEGRSKGLRSLARRRIVPLRADGLGRAAALRARVAG